MIAPVVFLVTDPRHDLARTTAVVRAAGSALGPGRLGVQLRDKAAAPEALCAAARALRDATHAVGALLVVNLGGAAGPRAALDAASRVGADGVHLPSGLAGLAGLGGLDGRGGLGGLDGLDGLDGLGGLGGLGGLAGLGDTASAHASAPATPLELPPALRFVSAAAHDDTEVRRAVAVGATAVLVSPIYATPGKGHPRGPVALTRARAAAGKDVAVYALGGIDPADAAGLDACASAGADGVAVVRALLDAEDPAGAALALASPWRRCP